MLSYRQGTLLTFGEVVLGRVAAERLSHPITHSARIPLYMHIDDENTELEFEY